MIPRMRTSKLRESEANLITQTLTTDSYIKYETLGSLQINSKYRTSSNMKVFGPTRDTSYYTCSVAISTMPARIHLHFPEPE